MKTLKKVLFAMAYISLMLSCSKSDESYYEDSLANPLKKGNNAQVSSGSYMLYIEQEYPCTNEIFSGNVLVEWQVSPHLYNEIIKKGILIGQTTNSVFEFTQHYSTSIGYSVGDNWTDESTAVIKKDGKPDSVLHWTSHRTINANGEVTVSFDHFFWHCLK